MKFILKLLSLFVTLFIFSQTSFAAWTAGSNAIAKSYNSSSVQKIGLGFPGGPKEWNVDVAFIGKVTLFSFNMTGYWNSGYHVNASVNVGEGVWTELNSAPQLMSRADLAFSAEAHMSYLAPGVKLDVWGFDSLTFDVIQGLNFLTGGNIASELNVRLEAPSIDTHLPFLNDGTAATITLPNIGIYNKDYTTYALSVNANRIPPLRKYMSGELGVAVGMKGKIDVGLDSIDYYTPLNSNSASLMLIGSQLGDKLGVNVASYAGSTVTVAERDYNFAAIPQVTIGLTPYINATIAGFSVALYVPQKRPPALLEATFTTKLTTVIKTKAFKGVYTVPAKSANTSNTTIPVTTIPVIANPNDLIKPSCSISVIDNRFPTVLNVTASDSSDLSPAVWFTVDGTVPTIVANQSIARTSGGVGKKSISFNLDHTATVKCIAKDNAGNISNVSSQLVVVRQVVMADQTLLDGSYVASGTTYTKKWSIKNVSNAPLTGLVARAVKNTTVTETIGIPAIQIKPTTIKAGQTGIVSVSFVVPQTVTTRTQYKAWNLFDGVGKPVQIGRNSNMVFWLALETQAAPPLLQPNNPQSTSFIDVSPSPSDGQGREMARVVYAGVNSGIVTAPSAANQWRYYPFKSITQAEFLKILVLSLHVALNTTGLAFSDVPVGNWAYKYVMTAKNLGWIKSPGVFGLNTPLSHEKMALYLARAGGWIPGTTQAGMLYSDVPSTTPTVYSAPAWNEIYQDIKSLINNRVLYTNYTNASKFNLATPVSRLDSLFLIERLVNAMNGLSSALGQAVNINNIAGKIHELGVNKPTATKIYKAYLNCRTSYLRNSSLAYLPVIGLPQGVTGKCSPISGVFSVVAKVSILGKPNKNVSLSLMLINEKLYEFTGDMLFTDISSGNYFYGYVKKLVDKKVINGQQTAFHQNNNLTMHDALFMITTLFYKKQYVSYLTAQPIKTSDQSNRIAFLKQQLGAIPWLSMAANNITKGQIYELLMKVIYNQVKAPTTALLTSSAVGSPVDYFDGDCSFFPVMGQINTCRGNHPLFATIGGYTNHTWRSEIITNGWDVYSTGLKAYGLLYADSNGNFVSTANIKRGEAVELLSKTFDFIGSHKWK